MTWRYSRTAMPAYSIVANAANAYVARTESRNPARRIGPRYKAMNGFVTPPEKCKSRVRRKRSVTICRIRERVGYYGDVEPVRRAGRLQCYPYWRFDMT